MSKKMFFFRARAEKGIAWHIDARSMVWTPIYNCKLANLIARLAAIVVKNGFPCFSFGFISHIVGKLALQDAFICLHVFCNYYQLSGSKIWFPLSFFCAVSGMLFLVHVYTETETFRPSLLSECFNPRQPARKTLHFPPNLSVKLESPLLEDFFLE